MAHANLADGLIGNVAGAPAKERASALVSRVSESASPGELTPAAPFTGAPTATLPQAADPDVRTIFAQARDKQPEWAATSVSERQRILRRLHDIVLDRQQEALDLVQVEAG